MFSSNMAPQRGMNQKTEYEYETRTNILIQRGASQGGY